MKSVFLIGIGGSGMLPLARLAHAKGYRVGGADSGMSPSLVKDLQLEGISVKSAHDASNIDGFQTVVYSSAIRPDHVEWSAAVEAGVEVLHRMDFLVSLLEDHPIQIAIAGTHGKTSTTTMLGWILQCLNLDPTIIAGGRAKFLPNGIRLGKSGIAVYETDESDASFLRAKGRNRIVLNVDEDHLDFYNSREKLHEAFVKFGNDCDRLVWNATDPGSIELIHQITSSKRSWVLGPDNNQPEELAQSGPQAKGNFLDDGDVFLYKGMKFQLSLPGRHFASNLMGAIILLEWMYEDRILSGEINLRKISEALETFPGVDRRMDLIYSKEFSIYDDYGHHPEEIRAVINALKGRTIHSKLRIIFEPHRYTRTKEHYKEFASVLSLADECYLLPLYSAGENPIHGVDSGLIASEMKNASLITQGEISGIIRQLSVGDILLFQGAGSVSRIARDAVKELGALGAQT